jgi:outer membrane protein OmpA-like peptidoglycan-associated protein
MRNMRLHNKAIGTKSIAIVVALGLAGCTLAPPMRVPAVDAGVSLAPSTQMPAQEVDEPMASLPRDGVEALRSQSPAPLAPSSVAVYNFGYSVKRPEATALKRVFDDGNETYLEFSTPPAADAGAFDAEGNPLRSERYGDYLVIPGVHSSALVQSRWLYSHVTAGPQEVRAATRLDSAPPTPGSVARLAAARAKKDEARMHEIDAPSDAAEPERKAGSINLVAREIGQRKTKLRGSSVTLIRVCFEEGGTVVNVSDETLSALVRAAMQSKRIVLRGRTDGTGSRKTNKQVAHARALSAKRMLTSAGIAANKIKLSYLAKGDYIAPNSTQEGRAENRRVDFVFVSPGQERIRVALSDDGRARIGAPVTLAQ